MDILETLKELNGYWEYTGGRYLAKLTSGLISDKFVNTGVLTCSPSHLMPAVTHLIGEGAKDDEFLNTIRTASVGTNFPLYVCGPAMGGVTFAYEMARKLGATAIFTEPVYEVDYRAEELAAGQPAKESVRKRGQQLKRFEIPEDATVLFVEDVITTGKSTQQMVDAVHRATGKDFGVPGGFLPYVLCLVNRSGWDEVLWTSEDNHDDTGFKIISLADIQARTWASIEEAKMDLQPEIKSWQEACAGKDNASLEPKLEVVRPKDDWDKLISGA